MVYPNFHSRLRCLAPHRRHHRNYQKELYLGANQLTNVKGLEILTQLTRLNLSGNKLTDVKGLANLTKLTSLNLQSNPDLTKAQIAELQKALPKCNILHNATK